jgi:hypothetical protein
MEYVMPAVLDGDECIQVSCSGDWVATAQSIAE